MKNTWEMEGLVGCGNKREKSTPLFLHQCYIGGRTGDSRASSREVYKADGKTLLSR